jgi:hypothetical protein
MIITRAIIPITPTSRIMVVSVIEKTESDTSSAMSPDELLATTRTRYCSPLGNVSTCQKTGPSSVSRKIAVHVAPASAE